MIARVNGTTRGARDATRVQRDNTRDNASEPDDDAESDDAESDVLDAVAATDLRLYDASDLPWITIVIDHVMSCLGQPWRLLRERLEHAPIRGDRVAAILGAMRRMMDGKAQRTKIARKVRASVLGHPALDEDARADRLAKAGEDLGIDPSEIESLLWIDLAEERPVTLPSGRPDETRLAAYANVDRIQRALRRAKHVRIHAWGNAHPLVRMAARYGLLVRVSSTSPVSRDAPTSRDATIVDIIGPLSLFHQTHVYGRALGAIVPSLAGLDRFIVEIDADFGYGMAALRVVSPALLPPLPTNERGKPSIATKIASAMERIGGVLVERDPSPIAHGSDRLFPDLAIEIVGPSRVRRSTLADRDDDRANNRSDDRSDARTYNRSDDRSDDHDDDRTNDRDDSPDDDRDLVPDLAALLAAQMNDAADRIAREVVAPLPANQPDRSRCWFVEVVGFATTEYLTAKLARYDAAGIEHVLLVVDETREVGLADVRRVVRYDRRSIVADLLAVMEASRSSGPPRARGEIVEESK